ncbi:MAG TPA: zf-HC2 domain-containing protein [Gemmatimonadales bacterium]|nr:zf-HC2 domain-containing protein [Gemmatimonadales bacterium]
MNDSETQAACEAILRRLDDYIDRELSPSDMQMVERHIEECLRCGGRYRFEISLIREVRSRLRRICPPDDLVARIRLRLDAEAAG